MGASNTARMTLRPYQEQALSDLRAALAQSTDTPKSALLVLPTGAGKTRTAAESIRRALARGWQCTTLTHRQELAEQMAGALQGQGIHALPWIGGGPPPSLCRVVVVGIDTLAASPYRLSAEYVVVDEAHHAVAETWRAAIDHMSPRVVVGLTATPCRLDGTGLGEVFSQLVCGPSEEQLVAQGHLAPLRVRSPPPDPEDRRPPVSPESLADWLASRRGEGVPAIAYLPTVGESRACAERLRAKGVPAHHLDGAMGRTERRRVLGALRAGDVVCNVGVLTEGTDVPDVQIVAVGARYQSLALWRQVAGRAARPATGKAEGLVLDGGGNCWRHGHPQEDLRPWWTLAGAPPDRATREDAAGAVQIRQCHECWGWHPGPWLQCPACGWQVPPVQRQGYTLTRAQISDASRERIQAYRASRGADTDRERAHLWRSAMAQAQRGQLTLGRAIRQYAAAYGAPPFREDWFTSADWRTVNHLKKR